MSLKISILFVLFIFVSSCKEEKHPIPNVPVDIQIDPNSPEFPYLQIDNGSAYVRGGYNGNGIIVFKKPFADFVAFDRTCPHDIYNTNSVVIVQNPYDIIATDTVCGSRFSLLDGSVLEGPSKFPLKQYDANYSNGWLYIRN